MSWSFSYSLQTFRAITSSLSQCHRYKRFTHKVVHFGLFHSQKTKKSMYPLHKYVHSVVISTCCFFVNRCWSHGALLDDVFIFLTKIAIPAISLMVMAVETVQILKSPKRNVSVLLFKQSCLIQPSCCLLGQYIYCSVNWFRKCIHLV